MDRKLKTRFVVAAAAKFVLSAVLVLSGWHTDGATNHPPANGSGIAYFHDEVKDVPWSIHVVKVDRSRKDLRFTTTMGQTSALGMSLVSDQVKTIPPEFGRPLAAINGDFYRNSRRNPGDPEGVQIVRDELVSAPNAARSCFWIDADGAPHITNVAPRFTVTWPDGTKTPFGLNEERGSDAAVLYTSAMGASTRTSGGIELLLDRVGSNAPWPLRIGTAYTMRVRQVTTSGDSALSRDGAVLSFGPRLALRLPRVSEGTELKISIATEPDMKGAQIAIGGGPALVRNGKAVSFSGQQPRHPRSALGWNKDHFFLVEVDGRQKNSVGMSWPELANYMLTKLGCDEALNLDGGGSATMWVLGNVMNSPSEGRERPAANALVVVQVKHQSN